MADLQASPDVDLALSGFGEDEIADLLRSLETREKKERAEDFDLDSALEDATRAPRTRPGDLWALGEHRLLCGDATKPEDVERLLGGTKASMAFTDPPYNVSLGDHGGQQRGSRRRRIANDSMDPISWEAFVRAWSRTFSLVWMAPSTSACRARSCRWCPAFSPRRAATGATRSYGTRIASCSVVPTISVRTSRSGSGGVQEQATTGVVIETRTTSGRSTDQAMRRSTDHEAPAVDGARDRQQLDAR